MFSDPRMESDTSTEENSVGENLGYFYEMPLSEVFQPYDFEPIPSSQTQNEPDTQTNSGVGIEQLAPRIGNNSWCRCGKCRIMENEEQSVCQIDISTERFASQKTMIFK